MWHVPVSEKSNTPFHIPKIRFSSKKLLLFQLKLLWGLTHPESLHRGLCKPPFSTLINFYFDCGHTHSVYIHSLPQCNGCSAFGISANIIPMQRQISFKIVWFLLSCFKPLGFQNIYASVFF